MEVDMKAGGENFTPFSKFVDQRKITTGWKAHPASPSTVMNVATLPVGQSKRNLKGFLKERLFSPNHDVRAVLYKTLVKRIPCKQSMFSSEMYDDFISEHYPNVTSHEEAPLPSFISDIDDLPFYCLNDHGKMEMKRILTCVNHHFPQITYCPMLPAITAMLLHYDDSPSQVFTHICHIIFNNAKYIHYLDQNKNEVQASTHLLTDLVQRFAPSSHKTLINLTTNPAEIYCQWLNVLFYGLPFSYLVILFDMYLLEGYKALFRSAISVLKFYRKVGMSGTADIISAVFEFVRGIDTKVSTNLLFRKAYNLKLPNSKELYKLHYKKLSGMVETLSVHKDVETSRGRAPWRYIGTVRNISSDIADENLLSNLYCWLPERYSLCSPVLLFSTNKDGYNMEAFFRASYDHIPTFLLIKTTENAVIGAFLTSDWSERKSGNKCYFGSGETFLFTLVPECKPYFWAGIKIGTNRSIGQDTRCTGSISSTENIDSPEKFQRKKIARGVTLPPIHTDSSQHSSHSSSSQSLPSSNRSSREPSVVLPPLIVSPLAVEPPPSTSQSTTTDEKLSPVPVAKDLFMFADETGIIIGGGNGMGMYIDSSFSHCTTEKCDTFQNNPLVPEGAFQCALVELFAFES